MMYLDHNATTYMLPEVKRILNDLMDCVLNPSSIHQYGVKAKNLIEQARYSIAESLKINLREYDLIFTSSGTEANNLIMRNFYGEDKITVISAIEHLSVYEHIRYNQNIRVCGVDNQGLIDLGKLEGIMEGTTELLNDKINNKELNNKATRKQSRDLENIAQIQKKGAKLLSFIYANNETGVLQPIHMISDLAKKYGFLIHSDLSQAIGKIELSEEIINSLDYFTISSHKIGGPLGVGALFVRKKYPVIPQIIGGGQEKGIRSGTENVIAIAGFAKAAEYAVKNVENYGEHTSKLQNILENSILDRAQEIIGHEINVKQILTLGDVERAARLNLPIIAGYGIKRLPNTSMIIMPKINSQLQLIKMDLAGIAISNGSACSSGKIKTSHVLKAMGYTDDLAGNGIRVSSSWGNNEDEIMRFCKIWGEIYDGWQIKK